MQQEGENPRGYAVSSTSEDACDGKPKESDDVEMRSHNSLNNTSRPSQQSDQGTQEDLTVWECFKYAVQTWLYVCARSTPKIAMIGMLMWTYYLPSIVLTPSLLRTVKPILYEVLRNALAITTFWSTLIFCFGYLFGFQTISRAIFCVIAPVWALETSVILIVFYKDLELYLLIVNCISSVTVLMSLYVISKSRLPENASHDQKKHYELTKDGTPLAILKGMGCMFVFVIFLLQNVFKYYIESTFYVQLAYRLCLFPICFWVSRWYQLYVIFGLSKEDTEKRLVVNKLSNHFMHLTSRIYLSNLVTSGSSSYRYLFVNLLIMVLEITSIFSHKYRMQVVYEAKLKGSAILAGMFWSKRSKVAPVIPMDLSQIEENNREVVTAERDIFISESVRFHSMQACDDISSEIFSICIAPLLMYFLYDIYPNTSFQTISSMYDCFYQIIVQLVFEFVSDVISLTFQLKKKYLTKDMVMKWKPLGKSFIVVWSTFCVVYVHRLIALYA